MGDVTSNCWVDSKKDYWPSNGFMGTGLSDWSGIKS